MTDLDNFRMRVREELARYGATSERQLLLASTLGMKRPQLIALQAELDAAGWDDCKAFISNEIRLRNQRLGRGGSRGHHTSQGSPARRGCK